MKELKERILNKLHLTPFLGVYTGRYLLARPKGSKNLPGGKKPGPKPNIPLQTLPNYTRFEISRFKKKMLELFESGEVENLSQAAARVGCSKVRAYHWKQDDRDWKDALVLCDEIIADDYEQRLMQPEQKYAQVFATIFMLNGLRPDKYKKDHKMVAVDPKVEILLNKLAEAKDKMDAPVVSEVEKPQAEGEFVFPILDMKAKV